MAPQIGRKKRYAPQRMSQVLAELMARQGLGQTQSLRQLQTAWREAVGVEVAPFTRVTGMKAGNLEILVASSVWVQELNYRKEELLASLTKLISKSPPRGLRFKVGPVR